MIFQNFRRVGLGVLALFLKKKKRHNLQTKIGRTTNKSRCFHVELFIGASQKSLLKSLRDSAKSKPSESAATPEVNDNDLVGRWRFRAFSDKPVAKWWDRCCHYLGIDILSGIFKDHQGHGTPENGKRDPYYSHTIPISLGILMGVVWE